MKPAGGGDAGQMQLEDLPDFQHQIFAACKLVLHEVYVEVQIFMIEFIDHFAPDHGAEFFQIHNESGFRVGHALDGDDEVKVVAMPVFVRTRSEHFRIFLFCPCGIV